MQQVSSTPTTFAAIVAQLRLHAITYLTCLLCATQMMTCFGPLSSSSFFVCLATNDNKLWLMLLREEKKSIEEGENEGK
jgi:hypothetical protein